MTTERQLHDELDDLQAQQRALLHRSQRIGMMLDGPRVTPLICSWQHFSYVEDEATYDDVARAFGELDGMEEHGMCSGVGVRVGGCLIMQAEWESPGRPLTETDEKARLDAEVQHRKLRRTMATS